MDVASSILNMSSSNVLWGGEVDVGIGLPEGDHGLVINDDEAPLAVYL